MSQQWIPISKKASTAPVATRHMLVAAVPEPRSLSGHISWWRVHTSELDRPAKAANMSLNTRVERFLIFCMIPDECIVNLCTYPCTGMQRILCMVEKILLTTSLRLSVPCSEIMMDLLMSAKKAWRGWQLCGLTVTQGAHTHTAPVTSPHCMPVTSLTQRTCLNAVEKHILLPWGLLCKGMNDCEPGKVRWGLCAQQRSFAFK